MKKGACGAWRSRVVWQALLVLALASLAGPWASAQEIRIRVLNARNGKPVTRECMNVSLGKWHGADILAGTNQDGVIVLHIANHVLEAEKACPGMPARASIPPSVSTIAILSGYHVDCQEHGRVLPDDLAKPDPLAQLAPAYSIKRILESGVAASNTCGKFRTDAKPGELITFVRSAGFLEKLRE